jgi:TonB family protein
MFPSPKRSALLSGLLHGGAILLVLAATGVKTPLLTRLNDVLVVPADIASYKFAGRSMGGGGGGGVHADSPASRGNPAPFARRQFLPPTVDIQTSAPILPIEPTLVGNPDIQMASFDYKRYGDPNGVPGKISGGPGDGDGIGSGTGTGIGPGKGPGLGPGERGGFGGGGVGYNGASAGGGVTAPTLVSKTEPEYSEEARKARLQGTVVLRIEVNTLGQAQNFSVRQRLGLGLDERAIEAVKKWKFIPGKVNGRPAVVVAYVEVNFRLL